MYGPNKLVWSLWRVTDTERVTQGHLSSHPSITPYSSQLTSISSRLIPLHPYLPDRAENDSFLREQAALTFIPRLLFAGAITSLSAQPRWVLSDVAPQKEGAGMKVKMPCDLRAGESRYGIPAAAVER
jgi:hypothetical protein